MTVGHTPTEVEVESTGRSRSSRSSFRLRKVVETLSAASRCRKDSSHPLPPLSSDQPRPSGGIDGATRRPATATAAADRDRRGWMRRECASHLRAVQERCIARLPSISASLSLVTATTAGDGFFVFVSRARLFSLLRALPSSRKRKTRCFAPKCKRALKSTLKTHSVAHGSRRTRHSYAIHDSASSGTSPHARKHLYYTRTRHAQLNILISRLVALTRRLRRVTFGIDVMRISGIRIRCAKRVLRQ